MMAQKEQIDRLFLMDEIHRLCPTTPAPDGHFAEEVLSRDTGITDMMRGYSVPNDARGGATE